MATIQKRMGKDGAVSYRAQVRLKGFLPESATFQRLTDAKAWAARMEIEIRAGRHFGHGRRQTFSDLLDEYEPYTATMLARFKDRQAQLSYWRRVLVSETVEGELSLAAAMARMEQLEELIREKDVHIIRLESEKKEAIRLCDEAKHALKQLQEERERVLHAA